MKQKKWEPNALVYDSVGIDAKLNIFVKSKNSSKRKLQKRFLSPSKSRSLEGNKKTCKEIFCNVSK